MGTHSYNNTVIDIHSHVLPGVDDGARTIEDSIQMLRIAAAAGTTEIVATPHANAQFVFQKENIEQVFGELRESSSEFIQVHLGCDFHLDYDNVLDAISDPAKYTINHGRYLMLEPPDYCSSQIMQQALKRLIEVNIVPIITHPERMNFLQTKFHELERLIDDGCLIQVTGQSFLGRFGPAAKASADSLLERGLVHVVASDAHDCVDRPPDLSPSYKYVASGYGPELADELFVHNPGAVVRNKFISPAEKRPSEKPRSFAFWK
ncbi:MAG: CpsB/CapC family capsule biosynthesis tyrosine phosphatase [Bryobacteraceae bacterium]